MLNYMAFKNVWSTDIKGEWEKGQSGVHSTFATQFQNTQENVNISIILDKSMPLPMSSCLNWLHFSEHSHKSVVTFL